MKTGQKSHIIPAALLLALLVSALLPVAVQSQNQVSFASVRVEVWPEYDQPSVLVIYNLSLAADVSLPADVSLRIPASARVHAVAMQDPGGLLNLNYEPVAAGDWVEIRFNTPVPDVVLEYYDPNLQKDGQRRDYTFNWPGDYAVENLSLNIQQPANATAMGFSPSIGDGRAASDGLVYYSYLAGSVDAGTPVNLEIWYEKPDDALTVSDSLQPAQPAAPVDTATSGRWPSDQVLPWAVGGLGLLLIAAGLLWYWQTGRSPQPEKRVSGRGSHGSRREQTGPSASAGQQAGGDDAIFCHQCGRKAAPGDQFCRTCGTRLH